MSDTRLCHNCGATNWATAPTCHHCAAPLGEVATVACPNCGATNWATALECHWCGYTTTGASSEVAATVEAEESADVWVREAWAEITAPTAGQARVEPEYVRCDNCSALNWPHSALCHHCGGWLRTPSHGSAPAYEPRGGIATASTEAGVVDGDTGAGASVGPVPFHRAPTAPAGSAGTTPIPDPRSSAVPVPQARQADDEAPEVSGPTDSSRPVEVDAETLQRHLDADDYVRRRSGFVAPGQSPVRLGDILVEDGIISIDELEGALQAQYAGPTRRRLGEVLIESRLATEEQVTVALARRLGVTYVDLDSKPIDTSILRIVPMDLCVKLDAVAYEIGDEDEIHLAMADPTNVVAADDLSVLTGRRVVVAAALPSAVERTLNRLSGDSLIEFNAADDEEGRARSLVDTLLSDAVRRKASDLHIEPKSNRTLIRARIDGKLRPLLTTDQGVHQSMVNRLKILSDLDISMRRLPQDGKVFMVVDGRRVHARVSTLPATNGEKVVLRIADEGGGISTLDDCGFGPTQLEVFRDAISMSQGLILMTGPTGSGKTTTLYTALNEVARPDLNLVTLEDPVERDLDVATQVQINEKTGLTFPAALRSVLRQDPDVVMVGEVRDLETANITLRASLSGHLVFSTIHTNDTSSTLTRLIEMGIEPYLVGSALSLVVAQRLVRSLCPKCAEPAPAPREEAARFGIRLPQLGQWRVAHGCPACFSSGYQGRLGIYEVLPLSEEMRDVLRPGITDVEIFRIGRAEGLSTLWEQGLSAIARGVTTMTEIGRVLRGTRIPADIAAGDDDQGDPEPS